MRDLCCFVLLLLFWVASGYAQSNSYLVWAGDFPRNRKNRRDFGARLWAADVYSVLPIM